MSSTPALPAERLMMPRETIRWAVGSSVLTCLVLLVCIQYCPTYGVGKLTLIQLWLGTFWDSLSGQVSSMLGGHPTTSLAAEASESEWTHCVLVPFITAGLVYWMWPRLKLTPVRPANAGYAILAGGFLLYIAGFLMENYYVGMAATELVYAGLIVLYLGWRFMRELLFPWAFLMFMWPYSFMEDVALQLRLVMSLLSHYALNLIGVDNLLQGTAIMSNPTSGHPFAIDIADPCSGIRGLFALVMIAVVYAFIAFRRLWQQLVIIAVYVPLVLVGNLVRIVLLTLGTMHFGEKFALGTNDSPSWFHEGCGYFVYLINFSGLLLLGKLLERLSPPNPPPPARVPQASL